jgi:hypothetical protein
MNKERFDELMSATLLPSPVSMKRHGRCERKDKVLAIPMFL